MPKLKCAGIAGMKLWFWSNDHEPPHFHVKKSGEWEYRVCFLLDASEMFELKWAKTEKTTMSRQEREQIVELVAAHRPAILQEWEQAHP